MRRVTTRRVVYRLVYPTCTCPSWGINRYSTLSFRRPLLWYASLCTHDGGMSRRPSPSVASSLSTRVLCHALCPSLLVNPLSSGSQSQTLLPCVSGLQAFTALGPGTRFYDHLTRRLGGLALDPFPTLVTSHYSRTCLLSGGGTPPHCPKIYFGIYTWDAGSAS